MLCPEVWNFSPPAHNLKFSEGNWKSSKDIPFIIKKHHFNHLISVVLPDTLLVPEGLIELLSEDCDYYKAHDFPLTMLLERGFVETFIKSGQLTALSVGTRIDCDNCIAVTTSGFLILSLLRDTYEELGLEGKPSAFCLRSKKPSRYLVTINLNDIDPKSHKYEKMYCCLSKFQSKNSFDLILAWDPPNGSKNICPSSVAAYLDKHDVHISLCCPKFTQRRAYNVNVPKISWENSEDGCSQSEILEWLGAFSMEIDLNNEDNDFVSRYHVPEPTVLCGQTAYLQWKGFYTTQQIILFLQHLERYIATRTFPWAAVHVSGYEDAPVSPGLTEHRRYGAIADISYTIFYQPMGKYFVSTLSSSQKLLKH